MLQNLGKLLFTMNGNSGRSGAAWGSDAAQRRGQQAAQADFVIPPTNGVHPSSVERELSKIEMETMLQAYRLRSLEYVTKAGMVAISNITALESTLSTSVPSAASRLRAVGDFATRAMAQEIAGLLP